MNKEYLKLVLFTLAGVGGVLVALPTWEFTPAVAGGLLLAVAAGLANAVGVDLKSQAPK